MGKANLKSKDRRDIRRCDLRSGKWNWKWNKWAKAEGRHAAQLSRINSARMVWPSQQGPLAPQRNSQATPSRSLEISKILNPTPLNNDDQSIRPWAPE